TVLLTPDGKPYFGGTYFPHDQLLKILAHAAADWAKDRERAEARGAQLAQALAKAAQRDATGPLGESLLLRFAKAQEREFDWKNGGRAGAPKFPPADALRLLLRIHRRTGEARTLQI